MKIHFNGAARTVTGTQHLIEVNGKQLLLDCGLFQGKRADTYERNLNFKYPPRKLDAVILSHAHIDHSGNLPNLVNQGYEGPIYCTPATAKLADVMLQDSGKIQEADIEYVNKKRARRGEEPVEPLYTRADAAQVAQYFVTKKYGHPFEVFDGVTATLYDAGHILGSAAIALDVRENGHTTRLWFSGDIGREGLPLINDPVLPQRPDVMIMECTYGDKRHDNVNSSYTELRDAVRRTVERRGKVIIPAFAVGRTQELVYDLNRMMSENEVPRVPVYIDSPLAVNASRVFQQFPELFDEETRQFVAEERHPALNFPGLTYIESVDESKALNDRRDPMIIISASGMAENGRILHHLRNNIENPKNTILIVSWQAPDTLGRRLADRETTVRIFGQIFEVNAEVVTIGGFSAHAGSDALLRYAQAAQPTLKRLFLVHGEERQAGVFEETLAQNGFRNVAYPELYETVELNGNL